VATDVGDVAAIIADAGTVVPARDPSALARALIDLLQLSSTQRATLGQRARARAVAEFSLTTTVARYETLYHMVLGTQRGARCAAS
jgi:glycosyltransferase involved in cell wall biosynthesis